MPLHPQPAAALEFLASLDLPPIETQDPVRVRAARAALVVPSAIQVPEVRELDCDGVAARCYRPTSDPTERTGVLVWFHGGGWALGSVDGHDDLCRDLCLRSGQTVVSVEYRLAPEHPFPAGLDDAVTATCWTHDHAAELGVDPTRIAVGGDSAGANLAAVVANRPPVPIAAQVLVYPVTDVGAETASYRENAEGYFLTAAGMRWFTGHYLSGGEGSPTDPRVSPAREPDEVLAASPPAVVVTAEYDPLRDEGDAYAIRLATLGVVTTHVRFQGQIHGFVSMADIIDDAHAARALVASSLVSAFRRQA